MKIARPKRPTTHPDRHLDCEETIEAAFQAVAAAAEAAGWSRHETAAALISLAENHALAVEGKHCRRRSTGWTSYQLPWSAFVPVTREGRNAQQRK